MDFVLSSFNDAHQILGRFISDTQTQQSMIEAINILTDSLGKNQKVFSCGNGGSMCDAMHFAEELTGRFRKNRRALPAMAISDPSHLSCVANDFGYDFVFSRYLEAFGASGDVLLAISTSGNSRNVINAVLEAKNKKMKTIALLGKGGGQLKEMCDISLVVDSAISDRIQEIHIKCIHIMIEGIERKLFPENY